MILALSLGCSTPPAPAAAPPPPRKPAGPLIGSERCPDALQDPDRQTLLDLVTGTYQSLVGRVGNGQRCPESAPTTLEVTISPGLDAPSADDKPCAGLVPVIVEVSTADGTLDAASWGWVTDRGLIPRSGFELQLRPGLPRKLYYYRGPGMRTVDECCARLLTEEQKALIPATLITGLQRVTFGHVGGKTGTNEIELVISPTTPDNDCGDTVATFEFRSATGKRVAGGSGQLVYGFRTCDQGGSCGHIVLYAGAAVEDQAALLGYHATERTTKLSGFLQADVVQGKLKDVRMSFEISCAGPYGIVMSSGAW